MTVGELINKIKDFPMDAPIQIETEIEKVFSEVTVGTETIWKEIKEINDLETKIVIVAQDY